MNRKIKAICAAILAAVMCVSLAGCGKDDTPPIVTNPNSELSSANNATSTPATTTSTSATTASTSAPMQSQAGSDSAPEKAALAITDEIKNADFNSGLVQINDDIFQMGGYLTVADFVEKYKDKYDIEFVNEKLPYDEAVKDQLLQSSDYVGESRYHLSLTLKGESDGTKRVYAQIENRTTSGGKDRIPISEGIVTGFGLNDKNMTTYPFWYPGGFTDSDKAKAYGFKDLETVNTGYTEGDFLKLLEDKGFTLYEGNSLGGDDRINHYWEKSVAYEFCTTGEANAFGKKPVYYYQVTVDPNTGKISAVRITKVKYIDA